jgi:hypothetical protein
MGRHQVSRQVEQENNKTETKPITKAAPNPQTRKKPQTTVINKKNLIASQSTVTKAF